MSSPAASTALALLFMFLAAIAAIPSAQAQFKTLYTFTGVTDGGSPYGRVIRDAQGNLYGTTLYGGDPTCGCGLVFKLTKAGKQTVLHTFTGGTDGAFPAAALIMDKVGNLYGTTSAGGGANGCLVNNGCGTVFKIDHRGKETVLYRFMGGSDGGALSSGLVIDKAGNLYGTAGIGGDFQCGAPYGCGVVYKLSKTRKQSVLYTFTGPDGAYPELDSLTTDGKGNFYGTTFGGGDPTCHCGVVFKLTKAGKETVLHTFTGGSMDGSSPASGVTVFKNSLYGATAQGGVNGKGVLFKISYIGETWQTPGAYNVLYQFGSGGSDGKNPMAGVIVCASGNVYGNTEQGGSTGYGTVYQVDKTGKETVLHNYDYSSDGGFPIAGFSWSHDRAGNLLLWGVASQGGNGKNGAGTVNEETYRSDNTLCTGH